MAKVNYNSRKFLNPKQGMAAIECNVEAGSYLREAVDANVSISDCNRQVQLDFSMYKKEDAKVKLAKINVIIEELSKFKEQLELAAAEAGLKR
jgi:hypothetical protein